MQMYECIYIWTATSENAPSDMCTKQRFRSACTSESSLGTFCIAKNAKFLHGDNEDWSHCDEAHAGLSLYWAYVTRHVFSHWVSYIILYMGTIILYIAFLNVDA